MLWGPWRALLSGSFEIPPVPLVLLRSPIQGVIFFVTKTWGILLTSQCCWWWPSTRGWRGWHPPGPPSHGESPWPRQSDGCQVPLGDRILSLFLWNNTRLFEDMKRQSRLVRTLSSKLCSWWHWWSTVSRPVKSYKKDAKILKPSRASIQERVTCLISIIARCSRAAQRKSMGQQSADYQLLEDRQAWPRCFI